MKKLLSLFCLYLLIPNAWAQESGVPSIKYLSVHPTVGLERVQKSDPVPHTTNRFIYGIRLLYGPPLLSAEAEITRGSDSKSFPDLGIRVEEETTNFMLGARSTIDVIPLLTATFRAGGHTRTSKIKRTEADVTVTREPAVRVSPYAGAGLTVSALHFLSINVGVTAIFTGYPESGDVEYQTTMGLGLSF
jgi:hypothetical protein